MVVFRLTFIAQSASYNSNHSKAINISENNTPADILPSVPRFIPTTIDNMSAKSSLSPTSLRMRISVTPEPLAHLETSKRPQRYIAQQAAQIITQQLTMKSPSKSPGKSPRQMEMLRQRSETTRGRPRGARNTGAGRGGSGGVPASRSTSSSSRGGRGRGRAPHIIPLPAAAMFEFGRMQPMGGIQDKLQGTVYDFDNDEDSASSVGDLKSMRDRGRLLESRQQHQPESYRMHDASETLKFATANNHKMARMVYGSEVRDLRPPSVSPNHANNLAIAQNLPSAASQAAPMEIDPAIPVDMRTYGNVEHIASQQLPHKLRMTYDYQQQSYTKVAISPYSVTNRTAEDNDADEQPDQLIYAPVTTLSKGTSSKAVASASTSADDFSGAHSNAHSWRKSHLNRYVVVVVFFFCICSNAPLNREQFFSIRAKLAATSATLFEMKSRPA